MIKKIPFSLIFLGVFDTFSKFIAYITLSKKALLLIVFEWALYSPVNTIKYSFPYSFDQTNWKLYPYFDILDAFKNIHY